MIKILQRNQTAAWILVAIGIVALLIIGTLRLAYVAIPTIQTSQSQVSELKFLLEGALFEGETTKFDNIREQLIDIQATIDPASDLLFRVEKYAPSLSWLPFAEQELTAISIQMSRVQNDMDVASMLLDESTRLMADYLIVKEIILSTEDRDAGVIGTTAQQLQSGFTSSSNRISETVSMKRPFSVGLQTPQFRKMTLQLTTVEDHALVAADLGKQFSDLLIHILKLSDSASPLLAQFANNDMEEKLLTSEIKAITVQMVNEIQLVQEKSRIITNNNLRIGLDSWLLKQTASLQEVLEVLEVVGKASTVMLEVVGPTAELIENSEAGTLDHGSGLAKLFEAIDQSDKKFLELFEDLTKAQKILADLQSKDDGFGENLTILSNAVHKFNSGLGLVTSLASVSDQLLGNDGIRTYLLIGQSADELRATGGFVSSVWTVTLQDGVLLNIKYTDAVRVDDWERIDYYPKAPPGLDEHMNAWVWLLRDVSWDPDFPTTAQTTADIFELGQRQKVDGVIAFNQWTLLRLLESLGGIPAPSGTLVTENNLLPILEKGTDQHGRAYMDLVFQGLVDKLNNPMSIFELARLASGISDTLQTRDTLLFFNDEKIQNMISSFGWDGQITGGKTDYLYVVDSNVGWNKVDRNIERDIEYVVDLSRGPLPRINLTLGYSNHSGPPSSSCEPQWLLRGTNYNQQKNACYWNFLRVYMPQGSRLLSATPMPLPEYSVSVEIGRGTPEQNTAQISSEHGQMVFSGISALEAGDRKEINLVYDLPASVLSRQEKSLVYELLIQKQPGVRRRNTSVSIIPPDGFKLFSTSIPKTRSLTDREEFSLAVTEDTLLTVEFKKFESDSS